MTTYRIVRFYERDDVKNRTTLKGLTLEQAKAHCNDPKTQGYDQKLGHYFDGYTKED